MSGQRLDNGDHGRGGRNEAKTYTDGPLDELGRGLGHDLEKDDVCPASCQDGDADTDEPKQQVEFGVLCLQLALEAMDKVG